MDKTEDFLQHWGIKGMKWDNKKKPDKALSEKERLAKLDAEEAGRHGLILERSGYGPSGYRDEYGNLYQGTLSDAIKKKMEDDIYYTKHSRPTLHLTPFQLKSANAAAAAKNAYNKPSPRVDVSTNVHDISNHVTTKGKSFVEKLFSR